MPVRDELAAVILAAGYSSRMSDFKPLLPLGDSTVIGTAISVFRDAGINDITVVVGHRSEELKIILDREHVRRVFNADYNQGMYSSIVAGLKSLRPDTRGFFLLPVDMPLVRSNTIELLTEAFDRLGPRIFYPTFQKERGHPPLIPPTIFSEILSWSGEGGLKALLERYEVCAAEVEVPDEGILLDIDTPEDYQNICRMVSVRPAYTRCKK